MSIIKQFIKTAVLLFICAFSSLALAKNYQIEVLLFEHLLNYSTPPAEIDEQSPSIPDYNQNNNTWSLANSLLNDSAAAISNSSNYQLKQHFSWGQAALPYSKASTYYINQVDTSGSIKVYANKLLFINIDVQHNGQLINTKRRLKLNEKHYFDSPAFGLLVQVSRLQEPSASVNEELINSH